MKLILWLKTKKKTYDNLPILNKAMLQIATYLLMFWVTTNFIRLLFTVFH